MAFSKARRLSDFIAADGTVPATKFATGTITSAMIADTSITPTDLHTSLDLTGKTVTVATASGTTNTTAAASTAFVQQELTTLIGGAPSTLNDLNELAAAINDDANYNSTLTTALATKLPLAGGTMTGALITSGNITSINAGGNQQLVTVANNTITANLGVFNANIPNTASLTTVGAHPLAFGTANTERMRIDASGTVSINNTLTVGGNITGTGAAAAMKAPYIQATNAGIASYGGTTPTFHSPSSGAAAFSMNNGERMRIAADGKVGIGTTNPSEKLVVNVNSTGIKAGLILNNQHGYGSGVGVASTALQFGRDNTPDNGQTIITGQIHSGNEAETSSNPGFMAFSTKNGASPYTLTERMRIDSSGKVGIGTTNPDGFKTKIHSTAKGLFVQSGAGGYTSLGFTGDGGTTKGSITSSSGLLYFGSENSGGTGSNGEIRVKPGTGNVMTIDASTNITTFVGEVSGPLFNGIVAHVGTTAPSSPAVGKLWFNNTSGAAAMYVYNGSGWDRMSNKLSATGGTVVTSGGYTYHTFTSSGTFTALSSGTVELLMVAGGGCGGSSTGGGGGAGGLIYNTNISVTPQSYTVTIGAGQPAAYKNTGRGSNSVALGLTAIGGGGGGWSEGDSTTGVAYSGGSGGGGQSYYGSPLAGGAGTSGQGNAGGTGAGSYSGGGGGAGAAAASATNPGGGPGGVGLAYSTIAAATSTGDGTYYAGGGGGTIGGNGGAGGGGNNDVAGSANTGGGGGGGWGHSANTVGSGGSGIVIIRYAV
jgi:hypothetical protein